MLPPVPAPWTCDSTGPAQRQRPSTTTHVTDVKAYGGSVMPGLISQHSTAQLPRVLLCAVECNRALGASVYAKSAKNTKPQSN
jgi:hypothetical protein